MTFTAVRYTLYMYMFCFLQYTYPSILQVLLKGVWFRKFILKNMNTCSITLDLEETAPVTLSLKFNVMAFQDRKQMKILK